MGKYECLNSRLDEIYDLRMNKKLFFSEIVKKLSLESTLNGNTYRKKGDTLSAYFRRKYPETNNGRNFGLISNKFDKIDDEFKAYWLGFIMADGTLITNTNEISIELAYHDHNHLVKLKNYLNVTNNIKTRIRYRKGTMLKSSILRFSSSTIYKQMLKLGLTPNKTKKGSFVDLSLIESNYHRHFWRGYIDGDGSITTENMSIAFNFDCGSIFLKFIEKLNIPSEYHDMRYSENDIYNSIRFPQQISKLILDIIYENSNIYLERKYKIYNQIVIKIQNYYIENNKILKYQKHQKRNKLILNFKNYKNMEFLEQIGHQGR
jgi:hypothetical protein